jgi:hypothetical protein
MQISAFTVTEVEVRCSRLHAGDDVRLQSKPGNSLSGGPSLILAIAVALIMILLFLRMVVFVAGTGHHHL